MESKCHWHGGGFNPCDEMYGAGFSRTTNNDSLIVLYGFVIFYCPFCGAFLKKPMEIKVGMFGTYANIKEELGCRWGVLGGYYPNRDNPFEIKGISDWKLFTPGLPTGFNQDGSPKEDCCL